MDASLFKSGFDAIYLTYWLEKVGSTSNNSQSRGSEQAGIDRHLFQSDLESAESYSEDEAKAKAAAAVVESRRVQILLLLRLRLLWPL